MAYISFKGLEAVELGGKLCMPKKPNTEQQLRLSKIAFDTEEKANQSIEVLASCFPEDTEYVRKFMTEQMLPLEMQKLANYLVAGEEGLALTNEAIARSLAKVEEK